MILYATTAWLVIPHVQVLPLLCIPLVIDGCAQLATSYESGNMRRLVTGVLFGYAVVGITCVSLTSGYRVGRRMGLAWKELLVK